MLGFRQKLWLLVFLGAIAFSLYQGLIGQEEIFNPEGLPLLWRFCRASLQPDLSPQFLHLTFQATLTTLAYAVCGTFLSIFLGIIFGIFSSKVWWRFLWRNPYLWVGTRGLLAFPRAIHEAIWGLFFLNIWGLDPLTAIFAIAIPYGAIVAKVFSEILDQTPRESLFALLGSGIPPLTAFIYSLIPQAFFNLLSYSFYRFECSIRAAAVLGIIGAGGLGYQILLSLQSLRYEQLWTLFYALVLLNGAVEMSSGFLRHRLGCTNRFDLNSGNLSKGGKGDIWLMRVFFCVIIAVPFCFWYISPNWNKLLSGRSWQLFRDLAQQSFTPEINGATIKQLLYLSGETLAMSLLAIAFAGIGALFLSYPALFPNTSKITQVTYIVTKVLLLFCRAIPAPIWALVALFVLFPGIFPGAMALGFHNLGILGRLMAEVTENNPHQPLQALRAMGTPTPLIFLYGVLPTTLPDYLAYTLYRWEVCIAQTVIVGLVGAGGLGQLLEEQRSSFDYSGMVVTLACFIILTFSVDLISAAARKS